MAGGRGAGGSRTLSELPAALEDSHDRGHNALSSLGLSVLISEAGSGTGAGALLSVQGAVLGSLVSSGSWELTRL